MMWWTRRDALRREYDKRREDLGHVLDAVASEAAGVLREHRIRGTVGSRVKRFDAMYRKLLERSAREEIDEPFEYLTDILGLRVVTPFLEDRGRIEALLRTRFEVVEVDVKGSSRGPGEFGYESTHLLVKIPQAVCEAYPEARVRVAEVQLRTTLQDAWAEVEHELVYKADIDRVDRSIRRKLMALSATLSLADTIFQEIRDYQRTRYADLHARHQALMDKVSTIPEKMAREHVVRAAGVAAHLGEPLPPTHAPAPARSALREAPPGPPPIPQEAAHADVSHLLVEALEAHLALDLERAVDLYTRVLAVEPSAAVYNHRGIAYFAMSRYEQAAEDFTRAVELAPKDARAFTNRGLALRMSGAPEEALRDLDHSLELNPTWADTLYGRALAHFDLGNIPEALRDCDRAIALKPDFKQVLRFKRYMQDRDI